jgi:hypothetical protein
VDAQPFEIGIDPLVQLLGVDSALVSTDVTAENTGEHSCTVGTEKVQTASRSASCASSGRGPALGTGATQTRPVRRTTPTSADARGGQPMRSTTPGRLFASDSTSSLARPGWSRTRRGSSSSEAPCPLPGTRPHAHSRLVDGRGDDNPVNTHAILDIELILRTATGDECDHERHHSADESDRGAEGVGTHCLKALC